MNCLVRTELYIICSMLLRFMQSMKIPLSLPFMDNSTVVPPSDELSEFPALQTACRNVATSDTNKERIYGCKTEAVQTYSRYQETDHKKAQ